MGFGGHGHYGLDSDAGDGGWVTTACVWLGSYIALVLVALCLTVGLFYLAEVRALHPGSARFDGVCVLSLELTQLLSPQLVEEHHKLVKRLLTYLIRAELGLHLALAALDTQPLGCVACGFVAHCCYAALLPRYPGFRVLSPEFCGAVALCAASHLLWGNHFYNHTYQPLEHCGAFFVVAVWPAPFLIFLSFGTIDGGLPMGGGPGDRHGRSGAGLLALLGLHAGGDGKREGRGGGGAGREAPWQGQEGHHTQTEAYHGHHSY
jgi:hypothetical protein